MGIGSQLSAAAGAGSRAVSPERLRELVAKVAAQMRLPPMSPEDALRAAQRGETLDLRTQAMLAKDTKTFNDDIPLDDLADVAGDSEIDNLDASATDIGDIGEAPPAPKKRGGASNLTPNTKKSDPESDLVGSIWQMTTPQDRESVSQKTAKSLLRSAQKYRTADGGYDPAFLAKLQPTPEDLDRLKVLEEMAGVSNADRAAEQIDTAAQAVSAANTPRPPAGNRSATQADLQAAKALAGEALPEGDWNALTAAFNAMDDDQRQAVLAAIPTDTRQFLAAMLDPNQQAPSFLPNLVAERTRPINDVDEMFAERDAATRAGDSETASMLNGLLQADGAAPKYDVTDAVRAVNERQAAAGALRNALLSQDEMVRSERSQMLRAATPPAQPAAITPGARTPEFAAEDIPEGEMPTAYDHVRAAQRDAKDRVAQQSPGGGLSEDVRKEAMNVDSQRGLPLFLRGRDRNPVLESRSRGERSIETNDAPAIQKASGLQTEIDAAQADVTAALAESQSASGVAELARVSQKVASARTRLADAFSAMDEAYPPRLVNPRTGAVKTFAGGEVPKGFVVERGRRAMPDSRLNSAGAMETYDDLVLALAGFRPRAERNITRATTGLSTDDVQSLQAEAGRVFGEDADPLLQGDFEPDWEVDPLDLEANGPQKKNRLGGGQQQSRIEGASQALFGDTNPFGLTNADGNPLFADADAVAEEILQKNRIFKPGTANYELAKANIARAVERKFATAAQVDPKAAKPVAAPGTDVVNNLESSATNLGADSVVPVATDAVAPVAGTPGADAVQPVSGRAKTVEEIQSEASGIEQQVRQQALDEGISKPKADKMARAARKKHVTEQMAARKAGGVQPVSGAAEPVAAADATTPAPDAAADGVKPVTETPAENIKADVSSPDEALPDEALPEVPGVTDEADGVPPPLPKSDGTTPVTSKPSLWSRAKWPLAGAAALTGGSILVNKMGGGSAGGSGGDWKMPDGVGPPGGGGEFVPLPAGRNADATLMDSAAAAAEVERLNKALERLRGQRAMNTGGASQTLMNYNGWR